MTIDDQLAELWAAGATFTDMGLKLGESRNAIAGRIDRARKSGDPRFGPKPKPEPIVVAELVATKSPEPKNLLLVDTPLNGCGWPPGAALRGVLDRVPDTVLVQFDLVLGSSGERTGCRSYHRD
jgi:hypothetical protein